MYGVISSRRFNRAIRKLRKSGILTAALDEEIESVIFSLAQCKPLEANYRDHALSGDFAGYRECHIRGDLLLLYRYERDAPIVTLSAIGSHSELFG